MWVGVVWGAGCGYAKTLSGWIRISATPNITDMLLTLTDSSVVAYPPVAALVARCFDLQSLILILTRTMGEWLCRWTQSARSDSTLGTPAVDAVIYVRC